MINEMCLYIALIHICWDQFYKRIRRDRWCKYYKEQFISFDLPRRREAGDQVSIKQLVSVC